MATLVLQAAGAYLGGFLGSLGGTIGAAAGALGGYLIDNALINSTRHTEGPRLAGAKPTTAEEGAALPFVYGTARLSGTLIWATRFEETSKTTRQGGKGGGAKNTEYSYFANAAYAVAEGEIAGIRRIWMDGKELDQTTVEMRVHRGTEGQQPDPLIEAKQGDGNAPAYRGTAYVVFERLPIDDYGRRLPQIQFEVMRPVGSLMKSITAVALIPGSTEFGLSPGIVTDEPKPGETRAINRNALRGHSDWNASMDELQALCPNLTHVALVVPWFGDDLRAGQCRIRPGVVERTARKPSRTWKVDGLVRATAHLVSRNAQGAAAYGGTPSDDSVIAAIRDAKARGLRVTFYPFIMMDIPAGNSLPSPYGGASQPAYPWRGRITCYPLSADRTATAASQIAAFLNGEWGYRRFVRHCTDLAVQAGGVDAFILGSEMRGLTTLRDAANGFPFVAGLAALTTEIRVKLGSTCKLTYAADWSEYFGHHPQDGSGDVYFHLDPLWAHPAMNAVGIDNYMPLSDWRDEDDRRFGPDRIGGAYDHDGLVAGIAGGEGFDWYYASEADRRNRVRSPITDGQGKPWVFRYKDLKSWWENPHYNRVGGAENATPTAWQPRSKPFWFTELGCPAVDKGPNQPNVFPDPKSSENAVPYFSDGSRSDLAQSRFLGAHLDYWNRAENAGMLDAARIYLWAWDMRPFPEFPLNRALWGDADNWRLGHWLNGRLSGVTLGDLIEAVFRDFGLPAPDTSTADGTLSGFVIGEPSSARSVLEPLLDLFGVQAFEEQGRFVFRSASRVSEPRLIQEVVMPDEGDPATSILEDRNDLPGAVEIFFSDPLRDYQTGSAIAVRSEGNGQGTETLTLAGMMEAGQARALAENWLKRRWAARRTTSLGIPWQYADLTVGDRISLTGDAGIREFVVTSLEDGAARAIQAVAIAPHVRSPDTGVLPAQPPGNSAANEGKPLFHLIDLPAWPGAEEATGQFRLAAYAKPWRGVSAYASPQADGFVLRALAGKRAIVGELISPLPPAAGSGRFIRAHPVDVMLYSGELSSQPMEQLFNGANTGLIQTPNGRWEIFQFLDAVETAEDQWRLTSLLRGQLGTEEEASVLKPAGTPFVLLGEAVASAGLQASEIGLALNWRIGTAGRDFSDAYFDTVEATGGLRALQALSPVHLAARRLANGDLAASWIRRSRIDADSWLGSDIPLGEEQELYRVEVWRGSSLLRTVEVREPRWTYAEADRIADLGGSAQAFELAVTMVSARTGPGRYGRIEVRL
ncbi:baseplate multidomain protein megatron [Phyllobacterium leguminum]|uniref:Putative tail protein n=1 Tax=Phyllobacterium leguminum TaxID=314237 RepID=A0A318T5L9_9HYPH|nr:glycoside hydrolase/phage tail family protein [Phyllobacterium leguminum]PYE88396.1 putative tail protein [Phyllobacterium leguminum]